MLGELRMLSTPPTNTADCIRVIRTTFDQLHIRKLAQTRCELMVVKLRDHLNGHVAVNDLLLNGELVHILTQNGGGVAPRQGYLTMKLT